MKKFIGVLYIFFIPVLFLWSASPLKEGIELFEENNVEEAVYLFEEAIITDPSEDAYKYLSESYNILGMHEDEVLVLEEAVLNGEGDLSWFYFKLGNAYHLIGDYKGALDSYLEVITLKKSFVNETFLNIANVSVELKLYPNAIENYTKYLELEPNSNQKRKIIKMIFLLKREYKAELARKEEEKKLEDDLQYQQNLEIEQQEKSRLAMMQETESMETEREARARALAEERSMYENAERMLLSDQADFKLAEEQVVNPPDPEIEAQRVLLQEREQDLLEREQKLIEAEEALRVTEQNIEERRTEVLKEVVNTTVIQTEESIAQEELLRLKREEELRQQALMDDILQSLEKIGENAKGISASSESAFGELEGSDIDE